MIDSDEDFLGTEDRNSTIATMPPDRPLTPTSLPHLDVMLTDDGSRTLRDRELGETFHSGCGACQNVGTFTCTTVDTPALDCPRRCNRTRAGTRLWNGMGWLITAAAAECHEGKLEYVSLEKRLLPADVLAQIDTSSAVATAITAGWIPPEYSIMSSIEKRWLAYRASLPIDPAIEYQVSPVIACG